jgi:hypothetical protein
LIRMNSKFTKSRPGTKARISTTSNSLSLKQTDYQEDTKKMKIGLIGRKIQLNQFPFLSKYRMRTTFNFSLVGVSGTLYYSNRKVILSLYQPQGSLTPEFPGRTNMSSNYGAYLIYKARFRIVFNNQTGTPVMVSMTPRIGMASDQQVSLQKDYLLPQSKSVILGSSTNPTCQKSLSIEVDPRTLFGYDTTIMNDGFLSLFGSNPALESGAMVIAQAIDLTTVPTVYCTCFAEYDCLGLNQKPTY